MKLVIDNSEADIEKNRATSRVEGSLVRLTANLMRVTRGAGKPEDVIDQVCAFIKAASEYEETTGSFLDSNIIANCLRLGWGLSREEKRSLSRESAAFALAEETICGGALQMVASQLLGQNSHSQMGNRELYDGIAELEQARIDSNNPPHRRERISGYNAEINEWDSCLGIKKQKK